MNFRRFLLGSLRYHARSHLGVLLGAAVGSAALIGALVIGHSVRRSLEDKAGNRLGDVELALDAGDRLFTDDLVKSFPGIDGRIGAGKGDRFKWGQDVRRPSAAGILRVRGTGAREDGTSRALDVHIHGVTPEFWALTARSTALREAASRDPWSTRLREESARDQQRWNRPSPGKVLINAALASRLRVGRGDTVILRFAKPSALSPDAVLSARNESGTALRLEVEEVLEGAEGGEFGLTAEARPALNAFVDLEQLRKASGVEGRLNLLLAGGGELVRSGEGWRMRFQRAMAGGGPEWIPELLRRRLYALALDLSQQRAPASLTLEQLGTGLVSRWRLEDGQLDLRLLPEVPPSKPGAADAVPPFVEVTTPRIFLDRPVMTAATAPDPNLPASDRESRAWLTNGVPLVTYLANSLRHGDRLVPYSMVCGVGAPWTPADMADDEILVNDWLASDLGLKAGDRVEMTYFDPEAGARLIEKTNAFRVRAVVPLAGLHADRTLMPEFPGLAKAESTKDWDAGFPLAHKIRDQDEAYWKAHRGTPKAFVTWNAGRKLWANRFGEATAVRFVVPSGETPAGFRQLLASNLRATLRPGDVGLAFQPVRERALTAARSGQDFAGLFIGFSFFLVLAALLLMALMFRFGLEQRLPEVGTLLAMGFTPRTVKRLWLAEGLLLACLGSLVGVVGGAFQARLMIHGLTHQWRDAVGGAALSWHVSGVVLVTGFVMSVLACVGAIQLTLRRQFLRPIRELLAGEVALPPRQGRSRGGLLGVAFCLAGVGLTGWAVVKGDAAGPETFFGGGSLLLVGGLALVSAWLGARANGGSSSAGPAAARWTGVGLALRGATRRRSRSLATVALLASGTFLIAALGAFRLDASRGAGARSSGTGGFALLGESSLPISQDLNTAAGLEFFGLGIQDLEGVSFVPFRVREGDDASCLNLNRAQQPRLLGVDPELLARRGAFAFAGWASGISPTNGWNALRLQTGGGSGGGASDVPEVPAIGDAASIQWALGKKLGDTLEMTDERGRPFRLRLVAGVANSVLQGNLVIDEAAFTRLFPGVGGHRWFLIDAPATTAEAVSGRLARALEDRGLALTPAAARLAEFHAVQNTYLSTFQVLGGFGLLLGSAGLGVVVLRNVLERRGELALLGAVGFDRGRLQRLVMLEHGALLAFGLGIGVVSAAVAVLPALWAPTTELPLASLALTLGGVVALGGLTTWLATRYSLRGPLLAALRGD